MVNDERQTVLNYAEKAYRKFVQQNEQYTPEDALIHALEEFDTGYDLTHDDYNSLVRAIERRVI